MGDVSKERQPTVLQSRTVVNHNARNALRGFVEQGMLAEFWTTVAWNPESGWNRFLPSSARSKLARRSVCEAPANLVRCVPLRELVRVGIIGTPMESLLSSGERAFSLVGMARNFDARVARRVKELRPEIVYGYEGSSFQTFQEAKRLGLRTCYELPSAYWYWEHKLFSEEAAENPAFANLHPKLKDSPGHLQWLDGELALADLVVVPSRHVLRTLAGVVPEEKIRVICYGAPEVKPRKPVNLDSKTPLKVLYVGSLIQRKGIGYLLDAVEMLEGRVELTMVGRRCTANARVDAACRRWRWFETIPNARVLELMQESDVMVLPSLSEGCALVVLEALACGLPVIVTPNTGSNEVLHDGREGFVVPVRQAEAIAGRLEVLYRDRAMLAEMSRQAQVTAAENSWDYYRDKLTRAVRSLAWR